MSRLFSRAVERGPRVIARKTRTAYSMLKNNGLRATFGYLKFKIGSVTGPQRPRLLVDLVDAAAVDWTELPARITDPIVVSDRPVRIAWIMSPPGRESGGHQNLFRFIRFAELAGHICDVYLYNAGDAAIDLPVIRDMLESSEAYPRLNGELQIWDRSVGVADGTEAIFATGWETAYPAFLDESRARRLYFVQDFEPLFYPLGSEALLAQNTYRFGFHGITAGGWLADKLRTEYGMKTDHFDFSVDRSLYTFDNTGRRNEIFFYARPVTPRRAFEFGLMVLTEFAKMRPDVTINLAGWDVSNWEIPFEFNNLSSLQLSELNAVYNRCAAGLVLSLSNMSLLPLELLSSGVIPVVNDGANNRMVSGNEYIVYVPASPMAIAQKLAEIVDRPDAPAYAALASKSVADTTWEDSGRAFVAAFERAMRG
ncbi:rhamnosyltransferase WsaF family glycosyltransferase [Leifsonia xyli]|uniref:rhamnosyltransferase WsaF family glycosyltransferase n=1 Tax=Leifsonia xyli TaxID=1575 RepID=UPI00159F03E0|nr:glycosyltransferase family 1 protein [Leifsonia xyli]